MQNFKDNFSRHADIYQKYRPQYPDSLFNFLSSLASGHELAWDCATGNGQAAQGLSEYFTKVMATDPSEAQISHATKNGSVEYKVEKAEDCSLPDNSVDLVTVAQALHWFDLDKFYNQVNRVLKTKGVFAAWAYHIPDITTEIDAIVHNLHNEELDPYWQYENRLVDKHYSTIPFPYPEIETPTFKIEKEITVDYCLGSIRSWSAVQRYIEQNGNNPVDLIEPKIREEWSKGSEKKLASWNLILKVGIKN